MQASSVKCASDIVFYQLSTKFVDNEREISKETADVMYFTLAVGHHTGIIDCFSEKIRCSRVTYEEILASLPQRSDARYKLEGIMRHGEIQVDKTHVDTLAPALEKLLMERNLASAQNQEREVLSEEAYSWLSSFVQALATIKQQPTIYLMGRDSSL